MPNGWKRKVTGGWKGKTVGGWKQKMADFRDEMYEANYRKGLIPSSAIHLSSALEMLRSGCGCSFVK